MDIALGADHAGYESKLEIRSLLLNLGHTVVDFGTNSLDSMDYPDVAHPLSNSVANNESDFGILICGSANGMSMTENKNKDIRAAICKTLSDLGTNYLDLFLIHRPPSDDDIIKCWSVLEDFYKQGILRNIGVSNFDIPHMQKISSFSKVPIYTNQIELSPFLKRPNVVKYMNDNGIMVSAHSSLAKGEKFDDSTIKMVAKKYNKTPAQIMLKWALQHNFKVIPRSSKKDHIVEDFNLGFKIDEDDMNSLDSISITHITHPQYILS
jgi:diketogulonate reductase-like aldo/keto reductase